MAASTTTSSRRRKDGWDLLARNDIAQPPNRTDQPGTELFAHAVHVHLDGIAADVLLPAIKLVLELRAREHDAWAQHHRFKHRPFARGEHGRFSVDRCFARDWIERHVVVREDRSCLPGAATNQ